MVISLPITELSYRYIETPIRKGQLGVLWQRVRSRGLWQRPVQVGEVLGDDYVVVSGLKAGDRVVVSGIQKIADGTPIKAQ